MALGGQDASSSRSDDSTLYDSEPEKPKPLSETEREFFEKFCRAVRLFRARLAGRPQIEIVGQKLVIKNREECAIVHGLRYKLREVNHWSIWSRGYKIRPIRIPDNMDTDLGPVFSKEVVYFFELCYAEIPFKPYIEIVEPISSLVGWTITNDEDKLWEARQFNLRILDVVRSVVLGEDVPPLRTISAKKSTLSLSQPLRKLRWTPSSWSMKSSLSKSAKRNAVAEAHLSVWSIKCAGLPAAAA